MNKHRHLLKEIRELSSPPEGFQHFPKWIKAENHLNLIRKNAHDDELIICAFGKHVFIHTLVLSNNKLSSIDHEDLLDWSTSPSERAASYMCGGNDIYIERKELFTGTRTLKGAMNLGFIRNFNDQNNKNTSYYELNQEYSHLNDLHWHPEKKAFCCLDNRGNFENVVSANIENDVFRNTSLVTFMRKPLMKYLTVSDSSLVRLFDFTMFVESWDKNWNTGQVTEHIVSKKFFYRQNIVTEYASYTRGVQIISSSLSKKEALENKEKQWGFREGNKKYVEFIAFDWRNKQIKNISTNPNSTINYFQNVESLPYELSPAFFNSEVLLKYKGNLDKYDVGRRYISCRGAWCLKDYGVNEAGQVHAYIRELRELPYEEQIYWRSFNEEPESEGNMPHSLPNILSKQAFRADFLAMWSEPSNSEKLLFLIQKWNDQNAPWWSLQDERLLSRIHTPLANSRDEWEKAFVTLTKLIVEGLNQKYIRSVLKERKIPYGKEEKSIALLEKLLGKKLDGLRSVQHVRSKASHASGESADEMSKTALTEHETYGNHFQHVCGKVEKELKSIEDFFTQQETENDTK